MEKVPAVASVGCKGTPAQAVALPGNVRPSRGVVHAPRKREATSGQAVMLPKPHNNMEIRSLEGILSAAVIHVTLHGRVSNGQITILKVVMERVLAVASLGSKGTPGQAGRCPGTPGQAAALPTHHDYERQHPAKP